MLKSTIHKLKMRLATIAPRIFGAESSLQKLSLSAFLKSHKLSPSKLREQEKCQKRQEIIDRCFAPAESISYKENFTHILASTDVPREPVTPELKERIISQVFSDDLTRKVGEVGHIELAASRQEDKEKLITKIETIKEAPLIHDEATLKDTVHSNVFGERLSQYSVTPTVLDEFDDIAKRCLKGKEHDYDSALLREVERIAVPMFQRSDYPHLQKTKSIFDKNEDPIDCIMGDEEASESTRNIESQNLGPPFETLLVREPTIFKEVEEAPHLQTNTISAPLHFFQEPLITQAAPQVTEMLQAAHHSATSVEPKLKPTVVEIEDSFFDDEPAIEYDPVLPDQTANNLNTSSRIIDVATITEAPKFKDKETEHEGLDVRELSENIQFSSAAKPAPEPFEAIQPQGKPMQASPDQAEAQPLNEKNMTLKQLLERIRQRSRMDYCRSSSTSEKAAPDASYPYPNPPQCPMPPTCPGGRPACVPPCSTPAGPCPGPGSKPQCIPPCEMPAGPCPHPSQKPSCSKCESARFNPFFKDLVLMLIQVGVALGPSPVISRIFSNFLYNANICGFATSDEFLPSKVDRPEEVSCLLNARDYEPWSPIPSWPIPKTEKKQPFVCPKEGCKLIPPPKLHPPCLENPCKNLPIPGTYPLSYNQIYNVGDF